MKTLSVKSTVLPEGKRIDWVNGMPEQKIVIDSKKFNKWAEYIHKQILKDRMWKINKVKPGGVCHIDGQESFLNQVKELLK